jgi:hypothetical protein
VIQEKAYFFMAEVVRETQKVMRQGTLNATSPRDAVDKVHTMGREVWKRPVAYVTILDPVTGNIEATSSVGDRVAAKLLPHIKDDGPVDMTDPGPSEGFVPWDKPIPAKQDSFYSNEVGTYFSPPSFSTLTHK